MWPPFFCCHRLAIVPSYGSHSTIMWYDQYQGLVLVVPKLGTKSGTVKKNVYSGDVITSDASLILEE